MNLISGGNLGGAPLSWSLSECCGRVGQGWHLKLHWPPSSSIFISLYGCGKTAEEPSNLFFQEGHRMERPNHCPPSLYSLMLDCWHGQVCKIWWNAFQFSFNQHRNLRDRTGLSLWRGFKSWWCNIISIHVTHCYLIIMMFVNLIPGERHPAWGLLAFAPSWGEY